MASLRRDARAGGVAPVTVRAAGGLVWRRFRGADQVLLVHRPAYDDWSFPKGKLERGEEEWTCAVREVEEETTLRCELGRDLGTISYRDSEGRPKVVRYWQMRAPRGRRAEPANEIDEVRWLRLDDAIARLSYTHDRDVARRFQPEPAPGEKVTVHLVRHAKAGDRSLWTKPDALRPLTGSGRAQADQIAKTLADHDIAKVLSSPLVRCVQTVAPLAELRDLALQTDDRLAEGADPATALAYLADQAAHGSVVACTHGDVMMLGVEQLLDEGVRLQGGKVAYKKACIWRLTVVDGVCTAARYVPAPKG
jgi:phosphohistidine phosphatase SixA/8-oxo-dGTP pyrophosphatase MutT (NUDIX family)